MTPVREMSWRGDALPPSAAPPTVEREALRRASGSSSCSDAMAMAFISPSFSF